MKALLLSLLIATDITIYNQLPSQESRREQVMVNEGQTSIEVYSDGDREDLTCVFFDGFTGEEVMTQAHTHHCYGVTNKLSLPAYVSVRVTNNEHHQIHYVLRAKSLP